MRVPESAIEFDPFDIRIRIENGLAPELLEVDPTDELEVSFPIPGPGIQDAELHIYAADDRTLVTLHLPLRDLRSLDKDWDMVTYPKPTKSPRPYKTKLHEHGEEYEKYRDAVVEAVTAELGLKPELSISDAVSEGGKPVFTCQEYEGAHGRFGPDLSNSASYLCGFHTDAFWELDESS